VKLPLERLLCLIVVSALTACSNIAPLVVPASRFQTPKPQTATAESGTAEQALQKAAGAEGGVSDETRQTIQRLTTPAREAVSLGGTDIALRFSDKDAIQLSADNLPVRELLNYVFGDLLKATFVVADGLPNLDSRLTLNSAGPTNSRAIYRMTAEALDGVGIVVVERDGVLFFGPKSGRTGGNLPIGYGRRPVDVPQSPGLILQIIPLRFGINSSIERVARDLTDVQLAFDAGQSALFVTAPRQSILRLLDLVRLLDQPSVAASNVGLITLTYVDSKTFATQMLALLESEGIPAGTGASSGKSVNFVPLENLGAVAVFATSAELLQRVEFWAAQIDRPTQGPAQQYFIYQPKYARASDLGESLAALLGAKSSGSTQQGNQARDTRSALGAGTEVNQQNALRRESGSGSGAQTTAATSIESDGLRIAIDPRSNSLVFYTTGLRYEALLPMIRRLDVPPKQVVLEATIAEVTLTGEFAYGVEFALSDKEGKWSGSSQPGIPAGGGLALNYISGLTEQARLRLTSGDSRVNVLSNPVLMVRDGVAATIAVGNDVPTVGATASDPLESNRQITAVLYRKTGLNLNIRPTINAQGAVVLEITQQISSAVPGSSGVEGAPIFFERSVQTEIVARSGQSVLLAGLISENRATNSQKLPGLGAIPGLGVLFRSDSKRNEKTELVLLITPRILESDDEWGSVVETMGRGVKFLSLPATVTNPVSQ
jgi:general secretion pathway protein D